MTARRDRFTEGLEILTDLCRSDREAVYVYSHHTRSLSETARAFGLGFGFDMRERKRDRRQDENAIHRMGDEGPV